MHDSYNNELTENKPFTFRISLFRKIIKKYLYNWLSFVVHVLLDIQHGLVVIYSSFFSIISGLCVMGGEIVLEGPAGMMALSEGYDPPPLVGGGEMATMACLTSVCKSKREVPRDVRNSKVRKQDKFRRDWSRRTLEHMQVPKWDRTRCPEE